MWLLWRRSSWSRHCAALCWEQMKFHKTSLTSSKLTAFSKNILQAQENCMWKTSSACPESQINGGHHLQGPYNHDMLCLKHIWIECSEFWRNDFPPRAQSLKPCFKMQFWSLKCDSGFKCQSVAKFSDGCSWSCVAFLSVAGIKQSSVLAFAT